MDKIYKYKKIAVCGFRDYGRALYKILKEEQIEIPYIIERNYESLRITEQIEIPIVGFNAGEIYALAEVLIITPDLDNELIEECLDMAEIHIPKLKMSDLIVE